MAGKPGEGRNVGSGEKRGGYGSSSKPASALKPPPAGPAPGATRPSATPSKG